MQSSVRTKPTYQLFVYPRDGVPDKTVVDPVREEIRALELQLNDNVMNRDIAQIVEDKVATFDDGLEHGHTMVLVDASGALCSYVQVFPGTDVDIQRLVDRRGVDMHLSFFGISNKCENMGLGVWTLLWMLKFLLSCPYGDLRISGSGPLSRMMTLRVDIRNTRAKVFYFTCGFTVLGETRDGYFLMEGMLMQIFYRVNFRTDGFSAPLTTEAVSRGDELTDPTRSTDDGPRRLTSPGNRATRTRGVDDVDPITQKSLRRKRQLNEQETEGEEPPPEGPLLQDVSKALKDWQKRCATLLKSDVVFLSRYLLTLNNPIKPFHHAFVREVLEERTMLSPHYKQTLWDIEVTTTAAELQQRRLQNDCCRLYCDALEFAECFETEYSMFRPGHVFDEQGYRMEENGCRNDLLVRLDMIFGHNGWIQQKPTHVWSPWVDAATISFLILLHHELLRYSQLSESNRRQLVTSPVTWIHWTVSAIEYVARLISSFLSCHKSATVSAIPAQHECVISGGNGSEYIWVSISNALALVEMMHRMHPSRVRDNAHPFDNIQLVEDAHIQSTLLFRRELVPCKVPYGDLNEEDVDHHEDVSVMLQYMSTLYEMILLTNVVACRKATTRNAIELCRRRVCRLCCGIVHTKFWQKLAERYEDDEETECRAQWQEYPIFRLSGVLQQQTHESTHGDESKRFHMARILHDGRTQGYWAPSEGARFGAFPALRDTDLIQTRIANGKVEFLCFVFGAESKCFASSDSSTKSDSQCCLRDCMLHGCTWIKEHRMYYGFVVSIVMADPSCQSSTEMRLVMFTTRVRQNAFAAWQPLDAPSLQVIRPHELTQIYRYAKSSEQLLKDTPLKLAEVNHFARQMVQQSFADAGIKVEARVCLDRKYQNEQGQATEDGGQRIQLATIRYDIACDDGCDACNASEYHGLGFFCTGPLQS